MKKGDEAISQAIEWWVDEELRLTLEVDGDVVKQHAPLTTEAAHRAIDDALAFDDEILILDLRRLRGVAKKTS